MSDFTAIRAVSMSLQALLKDEITKNPDPQLNGVGIDLLSPKEMELAGTPVGVSLWLYRVTRYGDILNNPPERPAPNQLRRQSLPVTLYYLVTPITTDPEGKQALLGRLLQVMNDHSILRGSDLGDSLKGSPIELRVVLETLTLEELTRIWNALEEPYQLSVTYMVQVVNIDSDLEPVQASPVTVKEAKYTQILSSS